MRSEHFLHLFHDSKQDLKSFFLYRPVHSAPTCIFVLAEWIVFSPATIFEFCFHFFLSIPPIEQMNVSKFFMIPTNK